jgi:hypothetical protein
MAAGSDPVPHQKLPQICKTWRDECSAQASPSGCCSSDNLPTKQTLGPENDPLEVAGYGCLGVSLAALAQTGGAMKQDNLRHDPMKKEERETIKMAA